MLFKIIGAAVETAAYDRILSKTGADAVNGLIQVLLSGGIWIFLAVIEQV